MMPMEDWLSSTMELCELATKSSASNVQDPVELLIDTQSFSQPPYDQSSILTSLEAYTHALNNAGCRTLLIKSERRGQNILKPTKTDTIHHWAEALAEEILDSVTCSHKANDTRESHSTEHNVEHHSNHALNPTITNKETQLREDQDSPVAERSVQDRVAERLATEIYIQALEDIARESGLTRSHNGQDLHVRGHALPSTVAGGQANLTDREKVLPTSVSQDRQDEDGMEVDDDITSLPNSLYSMMQLGHGSLDYPDAPPSTPLLPEMVRSRASFTRKLKGGLAKEFLPSPPPPTPKDYQAETVSEGAAATASHKADFMVRLMRSLSLECSLRGELCKADANKMEIEGGHQTSKLSDYADNLSADIVNWITAHLSDTTLKEEKTVDDLQITADQLAEEILAASLAEMMEKELEGQGDEARHPKKAQFAVTPFGQTAKASRSAKEGIPSNLATEPNTKERTHPTPLGVCENEGLRTFAERLTANVLVHALVELEQGTVPTNTSTNHLSSETAPWEGWANHSYAENLAQEVVAHSLKEASKYLSRQGQNSYIPCNLANSCSPGHQTAHSGGGQNDLVGWIGDQLSTDIQVLQCILLWAAASQVGTSTVRLDLSDIRLKQQVCRLTERARLIGWTVGDLMTSLFHYNDELNRASRGHHGSSVSLLHHLQEQLGGDEAK